MGMNPQDLMQMLQQRQTPQMQAPTPVGSGATTAPSGFTPGGMPTAPPDKLTEHHAHQAINLLLVYMQQLLQQPQMPTYQKMGFVTQLTQSISSLATLTQNNDADNAEQKQAELAIKQQESQMKIELDKAKLEIEKQKAELQMQIEQMKAEQKMQLDKQTADHKLEIEATKAQYDQAAQTQKMEQADDQHQQSLEQNDLNHQQQSYQQEENHQNKMSQQSEAHQSKLQQAKSKPD